MCDLCDDPGHLGPSYEEVEVGWDWELGRIISGDVRSGDVVAESEDSGRCWDQDMQGRSPLQMITDNVAAWLKRSHDSIATLVPEESHAPYRLACTVTTARGQELLATVKTAWDQVLRAPTDAEPTSVQAPSAATQHASSGVGVQDVAERAGVSAAMAMFATPLTGQALSSAHQVQQAQHGGAPAGVRPPAPTPAPGQAPR